MKTINDMIEEHNQYLEEVEEAVLHWGQWCDTFREACDKADQYDIDIRNVSDNELWDIEQNFIARYGRDNE